MRASAGSAMSVCARRNRQHPTRICLHAPAHGISKEIDLAQLLATTELARGQARASVPAIARDAPAYFRRSKPRRPPDRVSRPRCPGPRGSTRRIDISRREHMAAHERTAAHRRRGPEGRDEIMMMRHAAPEVLVAIAVKVRSTIGISTTRRKRTQARPRHFARITDESCHLFGMRSR